MARQERKLSARGVAAISKPGRHSDGAGLYLLLKGDNRSWVYLFAWQGRQCEMGLGAYPQTSLAEARELRDRWRRVLRDGRNPIDVRRDGSRASSAPTFGQCAGELLAAKSPQWRSQKHAQQWASTLHDYCKPLWFTPIDAVDTADVLAVLQPIWGRIPETASRVRGRVESVIDFARARGLRSGVNPASWRGHLALILPKRQRLAKGHHRALPYQDVPSLICRLREVESTAARALEFAILTASRSAETLRATWAEFDLESMVWTVPGHRMKSGAPHRVPLSGRAMEILGELFKAKTGEFVFPGQRHNAPLSPSALSMVLARLKTDSSVHGFRFAFRDWCGNETSFPRELAEQALAHRAGDSTELAYRRSDALSKRRVLMEAWAEYCEPSHTANVLPLRVGL
jgi:integrase